MWYVYASGQVLRVIQAAYDGDVKHNTGAPTRKLAVMEQCPRYLFDVCNYQALCLKSASQAVLYRQQGPQICAASTMPAQNTT